MKGILIIILSLGVTAGLVRAGELNGKARYNGRNIMQVTVVSLQGCEATPQTIALVKETAREMGLAIDFEHVVVRTAAEANEHRHIGSPTVQIDGLDIEPQARGITRFGIT